MMPRRRHPARARQQGLALLFLLVIATLGSLSLYLSNLSPVIQDNLRRQRTDFALREARDSLIGYSLRLRDLQRAQDPDALNDDDKMPYGLMPLPDLGSTRNGNVGCTTEGCEANTPAGISYDVNGVLPTLLGRFPWKSLGSQALRDGHGECLWLMVSSLHLNKRTSIVAGPAINGDTLGQLDIVTANGTNALLRILAQGGDADLRAHERPIAIVFSPGPPLPGQDRTSSGLDDVTECGGNYDARNYLDPFTASALAGTSNYLGNTNNASGTTGDSDRSNDPDAPKSVASLGAIFSTGTGTFVTGGCTDGACTQLTNDRGLALAPADLFAAVRDYSGYRTDINALLGSMNACLSQGIAAGTQNNLALGPVPANASCYGNDVDPKGYFSHYQEQILVATQGGAYTVNGESCAGVLVLSGERATGQLRRTTAERAAYTTNYLESINAVGGTLEFSGPKKFERTSSAQIASRDIVQCIPSGGGVQAVNGQTATLAQYSASTGTISLGQATGSGFAIASANDLFGCVWQAQTQPMSEGMRTYFTMRINDAGFTSAAAQGITFAVVDADNNSTGACGGSRQHLGYSGRNQSAAGVSTPFLVAPKLAFEIDLTRNSTFNPAATNAYSNGRNDPATTPVTGATGYRGGHVGAVYWGSENITDITPDPTAFWPYTCDWPRITDAVYGCVLPPDQDDNVHSYLLGSGSTRSAHAVPPYNPTAPGTATIGSGIYKLDPSISQTPVNQDFHVRLDITRGALRLDAVQAASTGNINTAAPGSTLDGVTLSTNSRILLKNQTTVSDNGVYLWQGASTALTRSDDADATGERENVLVNVLAGTTNAATAWRSDVSSAWTRIDGQAAQAGAWVAGADSIAVDGVLKARLAATSNVSIASGVTLISPFARIDGVVISLGDRILLTNQSTAAENGLYAVTDFGALSSPRYRLKRTSDADSAAELAGVVVEVSQGAAQARSLWRQTATALTVDASAQYWSNVRVKVSDSSAYPVNPANPSPLPDWPIMVNGDRVLIRGHASNRGIYIWQGAGVAMSRATDAASSAQRTGLAVQVQQGPDAAGWWLSDASDNWTRQYAVVATLLNVNLTTPGGNLIDGVTLATNDLVLVRAQTDTSENGIYRWTGSALARAAAYDSPSELAGAVVQVTGGTAAGRSFRQSALPSTGTLAATPADPGNPVTWAALDADTHYRVWAWILPDSGTSANQLAAMKNTTRPMSQLYPSFPAHVASQVLIGYPFRNARLGFTVGQSTGINDQTFTISNRKSTWPQ
jgi:hypothetical protein